MNAHHVDLIARHAAHGITRRGSVTALGGAALATLAGSVTSNAKKKKRRGKKALKKCKKQVGQCQSFVLEQCGNDPECEGIFLPLCKPFGKCHTGEALRLIFAAIGDA